MPDIPAIIKRIVTRYQQTIWWTVPGQGRVEVTGPKCDSPEEAFAKAKELATIMGWRRPKWREWWRWKDPRYDAAKRLKT